MIGLLVYTSKSVKLTEVFAFIFEAPDKSPFIFLFLFVSYFIDWKISAFCLFGNYTLLRTWCAGLSIFSLGIFFPNKKILGISQTNLRSKNAENYCLIWDVGLLRRCFFCNDYLSSVDENSLSLCPSIYKKISLLFFFAFESLFASWKKRALLWYHY